ncbi:MAG TPA: sigma-54 dependent transcriptional regulator [Planctomycetota bacterium]|nr:sigma-54 dependent transcriptional regulator [Planctomycetota bacterium]
MHILLVEDDDALSDLLRLHCQERGHSVDRVRRASECLPSVEARTPDCIFLDVRLGDGSGLDLLPVLKARRREVPVMVMTGFEPLHSASRATAGGAEGFLRKPFSVTDVDGVLAHFERCAKTRRPDREAGGATSGPSEAAFVGTSEAMTAVCRALGLSARSGVTTLIEGESGVGKELAARAVHSLSGADRPFAAVDCATIVETLFESELFGHEKGAFTGAHASRDGKVKIAEGGILFLDEIGELTPRMQAKLLRLLQTRTFEPVGSSRLRHAQFQLVAATNRSLERMVEQGAFRQDLFHRLNVLRILMPTLRDRREDIPALVEHFLAEIPPRIRLPVPVLSPEAMAALVAYDWPGNVRELENVVTRLVLEAQGRRIDRETVLARLVHRSDPPVRTLAALERSAVQAALERTGWNFGRTCELLGISRPTLRRKISRYGLRH